MNQEEKKQMELLEQAIDLFQQEVEAKDALIQEQTTISCRCTRKEYWLWPEHKQAEKYRHPVKSGGRFTCSKNLWGEWRAPPNRQNL